MSFNIKDSYTRTILTAHSGIILLFLTGKIFKNKDIILLSLAGMWWVGTIGYAVVSASLFGYTLRFFRYKLTKGHRDWWPKQWEVFLIHLIFVCVFYFLISPYETFKIRFWMYGNWLLIALIIASVLTGWWKKGSI